jgi:hypothetical protein
MARGIFAMSRSSSLAVWRNETYAQHSAPPKRPQASFRRAWPIIFILPEKQ